MPKFSLEHYLEHRPKADFISNFDSIFSSPDRAGVLLEHPHNLPENIVAEIGQGLASLEFNRYPFKTCETLRGDVSEWLNLPENCDVIFGNGALDLIDLVMQSLGPSGAVMVFEPDFFMYRMEARKYGIRLTSHRLDDRFELDANELKRRLQKNEPELLIFSNPHTPTAASFHLEDIKNILEQASGLVLIDEVYGPFAENPNGLIPLLDQYPNLLLLRSFSKIGAAAIRVGYLLGHRLVLSGINAYQTTSAVNGLSLLAARSIITHYSEIEAAVQKVVEAREMMLQQLRKLPYISVYPSNTNFIIVRLDEHDVHKVHRQLVENGVSVMSLQGDPVLAGCLRLSVDTPVMNNHAVNQFADVLRC